MHLARRDVDVLDDMNGIAKAGLDVAAHQAEFRAEIAGIVHQRRTRS